MYKFLIFFVLLSNACFANMASPVQDGTILSSAFSSKNIDILAEKIWVKIARDLETASFLVEYRIQSTQAGNQIPLLFFAEGFLDSFQVWVDGKPVAVSEVPGRYKEIRQSPFSNFGGAFHPGDDSADGEMTAIYWGKEERYLYRLQDLLYFETDLQPGEHIIRVKYNATVWMDRSGWIKKRSFRYSLTPAQFWKSFGSLTIQIEHPGPYNWFSTNLGKPLEKNFEKINTWVFDSLPDTYFELTYQDTLPPFAAFLIQIQPIGITLFFAGVLFLLQLWLLYFYHKKNLPVKRTSVLITGNFLIPLAILLVYMLSFGWIDTAIGKEAAGRHGYLFLSLIYYPVLLPGYALLLWLIDKYLIGRKTKDFSGKDKPTINY